MPYVKLASNPDPVKVPDGELNVLSILSKLNKAHGPAIVHASNGSVKLPSIYKFLDRLEKRGLVVKTMELVPVEDITTKRAFYQIHKDLDCSTFQ